MSLESEEMSPAVEFELYVDNTVKVVPLLPETFSPHTSGPKIEKLIGTTLLVGVLASTFLVLLGGIVYVSRHSTAVVNYRVFQGDHSDLRSLPAILESVKVFSGRGIVQFGLLLLVGLQVVRVFLTGVSFLADRDWVFVTITTIVLTLLTYGLFVEGAGIH